MKSQVSVDVMDFYYLQMRNESSSLQLEFRFCFLFAGELVAQFKFTVLLMPSGINLVTGLPFDAAQYESEHNILNAEMKDLVLSEIPNKSAKHKAKKAAANKGAAGAGDAKEVKKVKEVKEVVKDEAKVAK